MSWCFVKQPGRPALGVGDYVSLARGLRFLIAERLPSQLDDAKVRHSHCGLRILRKKFFIFFPAILFFLIRLTKICCGVAVLQFSKGYFHTLKILLYLYINIELIFDYHRICFGTATLQQVQQRCKTVEVNVFFSSAIFLRRSEIPLSTGLSFEEINMLWLGKNFFHHGHWQMHYSNRDTLTEDVNSLY